MLSQEAHGAVEETLFVLRRLMRDYLLLELQAAGLQHFDVERVIDDLVLFCMLVGNDFLPCKLAFVHPSAG